MTTTISAAANPALANDLINKAMAEEPKKIDPIISAPSDTTVELPGGYITPSGEVIRTAEVRELNGKDEEAIAKTTSVGKALMTILNRGTVKIGDIKADETLLDHLLAGDRDAILLGILKVTFGNTSEVSSYCKGCNDFKTVELNLDTDIKTKVLVNPIEDRVFTVSCKGGEILMQLPTGVVQKEIINNSDKTSAELNTLLLEHAVLKINDAPVYSKLQVQNLSIPDRKKLIEELNSRIPGPQFDDAIVTCPDCGNEVTVPINLGTLFQF